MQRYKIKISYDGTDYSGWQVQPDRVTIQQVIENAIKKITGQVVKIHGSGRTDNGVHAVAQIAHFDIETQMLPKALLRAVNCIINPDIRIISISKVSQAFHARKSAKSKEYRYFIWNGDQVTPFLYRYRTLIRQPLDVAAMKKAARQLIGRHDFSAFTANPNREVESTVRSLGMLKVTRRGQEITISASSNGFLYKMVRSLAGFLIRVGEGAVKPETATEVLNSQIRTARVPTAPAKGLFLWHVKY